MLKKFTQTALLLVVLCTTAKTYAQVSQAPDGIQFQALATDASGHPAAGRVIYVKDAIVAKTATGTIVYSETFKVTASSAGIFTIVLGKGTYASGVSSIANIDWANGPFFLNLKIAVEPTLPTASWNVNNEYVDLGTSQFWSVPYAMYAGNVKGADTKLNIADTANMLKPYMKKSDTASLSARIDANTNRVPYTGATKAVDLGAYDLTVNGMTVGLGKGSIASNSAMGIGALNSITTGAANTAIGNASMFRNLSGGGNTSIGWNSLSSNLTGNYNTASGINSLLYNTTGSNNTAMGDATLYNNDGSDNTAIGRYALVANTTGFINTALGSNSLSRNTVGSANTSIGSRTLYTNTTGTSITAIGYSADVAIDGLTNATAIGNGAVVTGSNHIQLGNGSIDSVFTSGKLKLGSITFPNTDGTVNQVLSTNGNGNVSWANIPSDTNRVPYTGATKAVNLGAYDLTVNGLTVGIGAGNSIFSDNTAIGKTALYNNSTGRLNTAIGMGALKSNTTGQQNTANGFNALSSNTTAYYNTAVGMNSLGATTTGSSNTAIGMLSLSNNTTGSNNTGIGMYALSAFGSNNTTGSNNTAIGNNSLSTNTSGSNNTAIGFSADVATNNLNNSTAIGYGANVAASNTIQLGNTSVTNVKTSGTLTADAVTYPKVHGTAGQVLSTTGSGTLAWTTPAAGPIFKQSRVKQNSITGTADSEIEVGGMAFRYNIQSQKIEVTRTTNLESEWQAYNTSHIIDGVSQALQRPDIISTGGAWRQLFNSWGNGSLTISGYYHSYEFEMTPYLRGQASDNHSFNIKILLDGWGVATLRVIYY
jgi:hypothetical protein